jgi:serine/threonine-protein kinase
MSQRFIRCAQCGMPHDELQVLCPSTGRSVRVGRAERVPAPPAPKARPPVSTPSPPAPRRDLIGKTIGGKYFVRSVLGEGGMGTVFEAEHLTIGRSVAVKVLHPNQARKKNSVRRFHQEARAAGSIGHPNICEVYDLGTFDDGSPYLVMERLVGETLADRIGAEGGLPFEDVIEVLVQVLSGLVAAHEKGIVHRDIKPENVFLTKRVGCPPLVKLLDFGVSKMIIPPLGGGEEDLDLTRTGMVMGTPYYMSPEQARGDRNLDVRVDLYACGVILYETLTGRRPYTAANYNALLLQILSTQPRPARDFRPALPSGFDAVLDTAMARNRDDRYPSAAAFQRDLQALRDRHNVPARRLGEDLAREVMPPAPPALSGDGPRRTNLSGEGPRKTNLELPPPAPPGPPEAWPIVPGPSYALREPTSSSVEIPITFSGETPQSGESLPLDDADLEEIGVRSDGAPEDAMTTQKRGPELAGALAQARRLVLEPPRSDGPAPPAIHDTDAMGRFAVHDTDATGRPSALRVQATEDPDTIIKPRSGLHLPGRRAAGGSDVSQVAGPDDTVQTDAETDSGDPTQLMASRAPKSPRG